MGEAPASISGGDGVAGVPNGGNSRVTRARLSGAQMRLDLGEGLLDVGVLLRPPPRPS